MGATAISICNSALVLCGAEQINTFEDSTREARLCSQLYERTKNAELQSYNWHWSLGQAELAKLVDTPRFDYENIFQLPTDLLRMVRKDGLRNDYRLFEDKLYTNASAVNIIYQFDPDPQDYPDYFIVALEYKMASILAAALVQDQDMSAAFDRLYRLAMTRAKQISSSETPTKQLPSHNFVLTAVRGTDA